MFGYYGITAAQALSRSAEIPVLWPYLLTVLPAGYVISVVVWLPCHWWLRQRRMKSLTSYVSTASAIWALVALVVIFYFSVRVQSPLEWWLGFVVAGAVMGMAYGALFWLVRFRGSESEW